jgi:hypothetical protein
MTRRARGMEMPDVKNQYFPLVGGLDTESAQLARKPGLVMGALNYESSTENGYERLGGFERFSGLPRPSDARFSILRAGTVFTGVAIGDTVNGQTSGATGKVIQLRGTSEIVITRQTGAFVAGENIRVSATVVGVFWGLSPDLSSTDDSTFSALAANDYRASIAQVPGSGPLRGIKWLGSTCYVFRDNVAATAAALYKSTAAGWVLVPFMRELRFTAGSGTPPAEGGTITKGAVTAIVRRVVLQTGTWQAGTAAGRFIVDSLVGGTFTAGGFTAGVTATAAGADTPISMLPGGRFEMEVYNFTGSLDTNRIYGCDGVNRGFEFDGTTLVPIVTGMTVDTPRHVAVHQNHLFFAFRGSIQNSGIGAPYAWTAVTGANEISAGGEVTGFDTLPGDPSTSALLAFTSSRTMILYGTSSADWKFVTFTPKLGAQRWSVQNIGSPVVFDAQGITRVTQSQQFGNFERKPMSSRITRFLQGRVVTASVVNRIAARMRIFFADGTGISITAVGDSLAFLPINYGKTVRCTCEALVDGVHRNFFGSDDGYVYEADRGRSFDGQRIVAWAKLAFNIVKSPGLRKRFRWANVEVKPQSATVLKFQGEYSLGAVDVGLSNVVELPIAGLGGLYDISNYEACYYDAPAQSSTHVRLDGTGTSLSLTVYSESAIELPHELQSVDTFFTPRRLERK